MQTSVTAFVIGFTTAYFAISAYRLFFGERKGSTRLHKTLGWIFIYWSISCAKDLLLTFPGMYNQTMLNATIAIDGWIALTYMALLYELTRPGWITFRHITMAAIPFAIYTAIFFYFKRNWIIYPIIGFLVCFGIYITISSYRHALKYLKYLHNHYSNLDNIDISWLKKLYWFIIGGLLSWVFISWINLPIADCLYYIFSIAIWHFVYIHCKSLLQMKGQDLEIQNIRDELVDKHKINYTFAGEMERIVEEEELYLDPDLMLESLAKRLSTNRSYLSNYLTNVVGKPFYDYINDLRINKKSIPMMIEHSEYTIDYIAVKSGFNSISTFRRSFYKVTGLTPGAYKEKNRHKTAENQQA